MASIFIFSLPFSHSHFQSHFLCLGVSICLLGTRPLIVSIRHGFWHSSSFYFSYRKVINKCVAGTAKWALGIGRSKGRLLMAKDPQPFSGFNVAIDVVIVIVDVSCRRLLTAVASSVVIRQSEWRISPCPSLSLPLSTLPAVLLPLIVGRSCISYFL